MLVRTNRNFFDVVEKEYRKAGDEFEVSQERFEELNEKVKGFVTEVEENKKSAPRKRSTAAKEEGKTSSK